MKYNKNSIKIYVTKSIEAFDLFDWLESFDAAGIKSTVIESWNVCGIQNKIHLIDKSSIIQQVFQK